MASFNGLKKDQKAILYGKFYANSAYFDIIDYVIVKEINEDNHGYIKSILANVIKNPEEFIKGLELQSYEIVLFAKNYIGYTAGFATGTYRK